jgi:hypothetical protein
MLARFAFSMAIMVAGGVIAGSASMAQAATVWSAGPNDVTFSKLASDAPATHQDAITSNVALTRGATQGLYNIVSESVFAHGVSPADTTWAFSGLNSNPTFSYGQGAAEFGLLTFAAWETSLGGGGALDGNIQARPGVVHLVTDDIYIDINFTTWGTAHTTADVAYTRAAAPVPEPASLSLLFLAAPLLLCRKSHRI